MMTAMMPDVRRALAEIQSIRGYLARRMAIRGYGPLTLALSTAQSRELNPSGSARIRSPTRGSSG